MPLESKLSCIWRRITRQDAIYSHTFLKPITYKRGTLYSTVFLKAEKVKEADDRFIINTHIFGKSGMHGTRRHPGEHSRQTTLNLIAQWETSILQGKSPDGKLILRKKPHFKRSIKTELIMDGVNLPHSVIRPEEKDVAAGMKALKKDLKKLGIR